MLLVILLLLYAEARDIPRQTNYIKKHIDQCPDVGYFFRREMPTPNSHSLGTCLLCFCKENDTAICWPRDNRRCDTEHYHHHGIGKREQPRSRRSLSLTDLFIRDATRDVINKQTPETCKPHEGSRSEGCPPVDWCIGCTVCDCDANGRWDCHLLSFCTDDDKKKKHITGNSRALNSGDVNAHVRTRPPKTNSEKAQREAQNLAKLISEIGEKRAKKYKGQMPKHRRKKMDGSYKDPFKPKKAHTRKNLSSLDAVSNPAWIHTESVKNSKGKVQLINQHTKVKKEKINANHVKVLADMRKKKKNNDLITEPTTTTTKTVKTKRSTRFSRTTTKAVQQPKTIAIRRSFTRPKPKPKPKVTRRKRKVTLTTTTTTTTEATTTARKKKRPVKRAVMMHQGKTLDEGKIIEHIRKKFNEKLHREMKNIVIEAATLHPESAPKVKRSPPLVKKSPHLVKKVKYMKDLGTLKNRTRSKALAKSVTRSSKINVDLSNRVKLHTRRNRRSLGHEDNFATPNLQKTRDDFSVQSLQVIPRSIIMNTDATTQSTNSYYKYSIKEDLLKKEFKNITAKGSVNKEDISRIFNETDRSPHNEQNRSFAIVTELPSHNSTNNNTMMVTVRYILPVINFKSDVQKRGINIPTNATHVDKNITVNSMQPIYVNKIFTEIIPIVYIKKKPNEDDIVNITDINIESEAPQWIDNPALSLNNSRNEPQIEEQNLAVKDLQIEPVEKYVVFNTQVKNERNETAVKTNQDEFDFVINVTDIITDPENDKTLNTEMPKLEVIHEKFDLNITNNYKESSAENTVFVSNTPQLEIINTSFIVNITDFNNSDHEREKEQNFSFIDASNESENYFAKPISKSNFSNNFVVKKDEKDEINTKSVIPIYDEKVKPISLFTTEQQDNETTAITSYPFTMHEGLLSTHITEKSILYDNIDIDHIQSKNDGISTERIIDVTSPKSQSVNSFKKLTESSSKENVNVITITKTNVKQNFTKLIELPSIIVPDKYEEQQNLKVISTFKIKDDVKSQQHNNVDTATITNQQLLKSNVNRKQDINIDLTKNNDFTKEIIIPDGNDSVTALTTENIFKVEDIIKTQADHEQSLDAKEKILDENAVNINFTQKDVPSSIVENYLKYKIDKDVANAPQKQKKTKKRKKGKKYNQKLRHNDKKQQTNHNNQNKQKHYKNKKPFIIPNNQESTTGPSKDVLNTVDTSDNKSNNWLENETETIDKVTIESPSFSEINNTASNIDVDQKYSNTKNKVNTYDIKKISLNPKKYKLKKIVTTLRDKTKKDERIYINNEGDLISTKTNNMNDFKKFVKKLMSGFESKTGSKKPNKVSQYKMVKYLQKFFKKMFGNHKNLNNTTDIPNLNRRTIMETLCSTFGPCNVNLKNNAKLLSQVDHLSSETYHMLRSVKTIKGLLKLLDFSTNDQNNVTANIISNRGFTSDIKKLRAILKNTYVDEDRFGKLSDTQITQIRHVKNTTQVFIQAVAKFTVTLNEIIDTITSSDLNTREHKANEEKLQKRNTNENMVQNITVKPESVQKLRDLISKYSVLQNTFINKIYKVLTNMDSKDVQEKAVRHTKFNKPVVQNKTEAIQLYTTNIIQNLRKLKHLAQSLSGKVRRKRELRDNDSIEYMLMLMEYLIKRNHPVNDEPASDGIDLIIDAIKNAPDIKPIQKKVLYEINPPTEHFSKPSLMEVNKDSERKELNDNTINSPEDEDDDDRFLFKKANPESTNRPIATTTQNDLATTSPTPGDADQTFLFFRGPNYKRPSVKHLAFTEAPEDLVMSFKPTFYTTSEKIIIKVSNASEDIKYDLFSADLEEDVVTTTEVVTTMIPLTTSPADKTDMDFKSEYTTTNQYKPKLDWLEETFEEEIKAEVNKSSLTTRLEKQTLENPKVTIKPKKIEDVSDLSKEASELNKNANDVLTRKEMELMNSLDYGAAKSDMSESKENVFEDKYCDDK